MPNSIILNIQNISPFASLTNEENSRNINFVRSISRQYVQNYVPDYPNNVIITNRSFPPIRSSFERVWQKYICQNEYLQEDIIIDIENISVGDGVVNLVNCFPFKSIRNLQHNDIPIYKYCVLISSLNILYLIFQNFSSHGYYPSSRYMPVHYIYVKNYNLNIPTFHKIINTNNVYHFSIGMSNLLYIWRKIPIGQNVDGACIYDFLSSLWMLYESSECLSTRAEVTSEFRISRSRIPLLWLEYTRRTQEQNFLDKNKLISIIEQSELSEETLSDIYNTILQMEKA